MRRFYIIGIILAPIALVCAGYAWAQFSGSGPFSGFAAGSDRPIEITSDLLEADLKERTALFSGNVVARQGDRVIHAERVRVSYDEKGKIVSLSAESKVKMSSKEGFATADELRLDNLAGTIKLVGQPRVVQGAQMILGDEMIFYIKTNRLEVTRPRIELRPDEIGKGGAGDGSQ